MQMVKRIIGALLLFIILLWIFAPKEELYYLLEKKLKQENIVIAHEHVKDTWIGLKIEDADIYLKGAKIAHIESVNISSFFLYNKISILNLEFNKAMQNVAPKTIDKTTILYSIVDPLHIKIDGEGSFGQLKGRVTLKERNIKLMIPQPKDIQSIKKFLKKDKTTGGWFYETNY